MPTATITSCSAVDGGSGTHILLFPIPAPGHIIPMIDLAQKLLTRGLTITILVPPKDLPLIQPLISHHPSSAHTLVLSAPDTPPSSPPNILAILRSYSELYNPILHWFQSHASPPSVIVSDLLLGWTHHLACHLSIPRVMFSPSGSSAFSIFNSLWRDAPKNDDPDCDENFPITFSGIPNSPTYPWCQISMVYRMGKEGDPDWEFFRDATLANMLSWGAMFNSFTELERVYIDHIKKLMGHDRVWAVGPLLPSENDVVGEVDRGGSNSVLVHEVMTWLDTQADDSVVYACFGSRMELSHTQIDVLADALENSGVHFVLCVQGERINSEFEERVASRGFVIRGWAPQVAILQHQAVGVFVTHCGWNSTIEGLASGVVMLTWPLGFDQFTNATLLVEYLKVARRACEGGKTVPHAGELTQLLIESVGGDWPEKARALKLRDAISEAVRDGTSRHNLDAFVKEVSQLKQ